MIQLSKIKQNLENYKTFDLTAKSKINKTVS